MDKPTDPLDELLTPDGKLTPAPEPKRRRRGFKIVGGTAVPVSAEHMIDDAETDPPDEIERLLRETALSNDRPFYDREKPKALAHEGKSDAGHTPDDKPNTDSEDAGSW